jgi:hypothetical protein
MNHNGTIYPESQINKGTEFVIRLPVHRRDVGSVTGSFVKPSRPGPVITQPTSDIPLGPPALAKSGED